jgi:CheY-like chemotaxis protein
MLMRALFGRRPGWTLEIVADGASALDAARRHAPDLLLVDLSLPDVDGIELLARLRRVDGLAGVPAVMVSAAAFDTDRRRAENAGFDEYWTKPLEVDRALERLDALLAGAGPAR